MSPTRSHITRLLHLALLLIVLHQLLSSMVMERPLPGDEPAWPYALHEQVGLVGLGVLALFWLWTLVRHPLETPVARLLPWFSASRLAAVFKDIASARSRCSFRSARRRWSSKPSPAPCMAWAFSSRRSWR